MEDLHLCVNDNADHAAVLLDLVQVLKKLPVSLTVRIPTKNEFKKWDCVCSLGLGKWQLMEKLPLYYAPIQSRFISLNNTTLQIRSNLHREKSRVRYCNNAFSFNHSLITKLFVDTYRYLLLSVNGIKKISKIPQRSTYFLKT